LQDSSNYINKNANESAIITPIIYENADIDRLRILTDNKEKAGIYQWEHKESGKSYIGSSVNLSNRLKNYFKISFISTKSRGNSYITRFYHMVILILVLR
jgi:hypothetical protein